MPNREIIIEVKGASFSYPEATEQAVKRVDLCAYRGEFLCVLGRNGSGKSTLAKLLNALFLPSEGSVVVGGIDTKTEGAEYDVRQRCGMVFQNPDNQLVATIVEEDVAFGLENLGVEPPEIRRRVDEALAMVGMSKYAVHAPHMLSGGQKQRVAIAGVLAMLPDVIVFDEATAMLDPKGRRDVLETVRMLNRERGITVVWITHFMEEAALSDRVVVMDAGEVALQGTPREVFAEADRVRALGLDVPPMTALSHLLRERGAALPEAILSVDEMVEQLSKEAEPELGWSGAEPVQRHGTPGGTAAPHGAIIEIKNLVHTYMEGSPFESTAIRDVTLNIKGGEFIGLIGHTGSGKSTLIQHMNGLLKPNSGTIVVDGHDLADKATNLREIRKRVGLVFQYPEYQLFEETVELDIGFGPRNLGLDAGEVTARVKEAAALVGLKSELLGKSPFELSGGQKRRCAIAGVLAMRPQLLILDEPTAGLDPKGREDMLNLLSALHSEQGNTMIMVSHSMSDVARLCGRILVMNEGRLAMDGTPEQVFARGDELIAMGLGLPDGARLARALREKGFDLPDSIWRIDELADAIAPQIAPRPKGVSADA